MRYRLGDGLWVRLLDVGAALSGRTYPEDGELVFDVRDDFCPWNEGRWRLAGGAAERTDADADLALDVTVARLRVSSEASASRSSPRAAASKS